MRCHLEREPRTDSGPLPDADWARLKEAADEDRTAIQRAWDGNIPCSPMVVCQPSAYHYRAERDPSGECRLVYRDALQEQLALVERHLRAGAMVVPMVLCDMNVLAISSLFDPELVPSPDGEDANVRPCLPDRRAVERMERPSIEGGLIPVILDETRRLRALMPEWMAVGVRLNTGPLSLAAELRGGTDLLMDMLEAPPVYARLLDIVTGLYIEVRDAIQAAAGIEVRAGSVRPDVSFHAPTAGVMLCDDLISLLDSQRFERYALPYLRRILAHYGGGTIHACGAPGHLLPVLRDVPEVLGFEFGQGDLVDWAAARAVLPEHNLIFWDLGADGTDYLVKARRAALEPRTFIYSQQLEHVHYWSAGRKR